MDYSNHSDMLVALKTQQDADEDNRNATRETTLFVSKRDGQWEPYWWNLNRGRPRYTFDMVSPIIDEITGDLEQNEFSIQIQPASGDASKETAETMDGMVRAIRNLSDADDLFDMAARRAITGGMDAFHVKYDYTDDESFEKDLIIESVANAVDCCWFGPFTKPDASDMECGWVLEAISRAEYEKRWPDREPVSVGQNRLANAYYFRNDLIIIGQFYYIEREEVTLWQMSNGSVMDANKELLPLLQMQGLTVTAIRESKRPTVKSRLFDGIDWLGDAEDTIFKRVPLIPMFVNFDIIEDKVIYFGVVEKLMDPQRVLNYSKSREIEEGALAPRAKYWATEAQIEGHEDEIATLNTNSDPVQLYNPDPATGNLGPPQQQGGAQINPGLAQLSGDMTGMIQMVANQHDAGMGKNPSPGTSGVAIEKLQDKGETSNRKYYKAVSRSIRSVGRLLLDAMPIAYSNERQMRILNEDGSYEMTQLNQPQFIPGIGMQINNNMRVGKYEVVCTVGPSFKSKQGETVAAFTEIAQIDPTIIEQGGDILYNNITAPGMAQMAERKRRDLFLAGRIPPDQLTDEERQEQEQAKLEAQQNPPPPPPEQILAEAEMKKGDAELGKVQAETQKINVDAQIAMAKEERERAKAAADAQIAMAKEERERAKVSADVQQTQTETAIDAQVAQAKLQQEEQKIALAAEKQKMEQYMAVQKQQSEQMQMMMNYVATQADMLKTIREGIGADGIVSPAALEAFDAQSRKLAQAVNQSGPMG